MILLSASQQVLVATSAGVTTSQVVFYAEFADKIKDSVTPITNDGTFNNANVVAVGSPANNTVREVEEMMFYNADTVTAIVIISFNDGINTRVVKKSSLNAGQTLTYVRGYGWAIN